MIHLTLSEENYKILHQMIGDQLEILFSPYDNDPNYEPTEEHRKIFDAVTMFSSFQVTHNI